jgi:hypothetical protein
MKILTPKCSLPLLPYLVDRSWALAPKTPQRHPGQMGDLRLQPTLTRRHCLVMYRSM